MLGSFLFSDDLLDLTDLFLNIAGVAFIFTFCFQVWIIVQLPDDLFDLALDLMLLAFRLVPCA